MPIMFTNTNHSYSEIQHNAENANGLSITSSTLKDTQINIGSDWPTRAEVSVTLQDISLEGHQSQFQLHLPLSDVDIHMDNVLFKSLRKQVEIFSGPNTKLTATNFTLSDAHVRGKCFELQMGLHSDARVNITNSKFLNNNCSMGGALTFSLDTLSMSNIMINNSLFENNTGNGCGSAIKVLSQSVVDKPILNIMHTSFLGNTNTESAAGVYIESAQVHIEKCTFANNAVRTGMKIVSDLDDRKGSGGALYLRQDAVAVVDQCTFINNSANWFGGSLSSSGTLELYNSTFENLHDTIQMALGDIVYITGPTLYNNLNFSIHTSFANWALIWYSSEMATLKGVDGGYINFECPKGAQLHNESLQAEDRPHIEYQHLFIFCNPCPEGSYSIARGHMAGEVSYDNVTYSGDFACHDCPYGGYCHGGNIRSTRNFWGYEKSITSSEVSFQVCPPGYCCKEDQCPTYQSCSDGRYGTLCGRCKPGLSESFFTTECKPNSQCHDSWYLVIDVLCAIGYILLFMYQQEISCFFLYTFLGIKNVDDPGVAATAYIKIIFYFYQVVDLSEIEGNDESPVKIFSLQPTISYLFTFRPIMALFNICPFPDMTPLKKLGLGLVPIGMTVLLLCILLILNKIYEHRKKARMHQSICTNPRSEGTPDFQIRLAVAFININLYGYINLVSTALTMLSCVPAEDRSVLYIDGTVTCMTPWQYVVIILFILLVAPFFLAVIFSRDLLETGAIGFMEFFLSYMLPFPMLIYWLCKWLHAKYRTQHYGIEVAPLQGFMDSHHHSSERLKSAILSLIEEPYVKKKDPEDSVVYWEGVLLFRRLCLCTVASLVVNPLLSRTLHTLLSLAFLIWHLTKLPFRTNTANHIETASLSTLVVLAMINLIKATYFAAGEQPSGPHVLQIQISAWLEWGLENAFPILILIALIAAIIRQIIRKSKDWKKPAQTPLIRLNNGKPEWYHGGI